MRIAYVLYWHFGAGSGVFEKVRRQTTAWRSWGHEPEVHIATSTEALPDWRSAVEVATSATWHGDGLDNLRAKAEVLRAALTSRAELVYVRYSPPPLWPTLGRSPPPVVVEINTDDRLEYRTEAPVKRVYNAVMRNRLLDRADGLACVTHELAATYGGGVPTAVIANGVDLNDVPVSPAPANDQVRAVFVSSHDLSWHGLDQMLALANARPEWYLDIIGLDRIPAAPTNVTGHGILTGDAFRALLQAADVAFGTLALHRKGMQEACPLKTRDYLAHGVPTIISYRETDFPHGAEFLLELPNEEGSLIDNLAAIDDFVARWRGRRVPRQEIAHLDSSTKERQRLVFLETVAEQVRSGTSR